MQKFIPTQSPYVDWLIHLLLQAKNSISTFSGGSLPSYVEKIVLEHLIEFVTKHLLNSYAWATVCNDIGWWSMERDVDIIQELIEKQFFKLWDTTCFKVLKDYITAYSYSPDQLILFAKRPLSIDNYSYR